MKMNIELEGKVLSLARKVSEKMGVSMPWVIKMAITKGLLCLLNKGEQKETAPPGDGAESA